MRVLHVISSLSPGAGGPTTALLGLAVAQARAGLAVTVLATHAPDEPTTVSDALVRSGVPVQLIGPARGRLHRAPGLAAAVDLAVADAGLVHIHALWEEVQHQAARAARRRSVPYVIRPCGMLDPWSLGQSKWAKRLVLAWRVRKDLDRAAALHFTTAAERDLAMPLRLRPAPIVEPNGIHLEEFASLPPAGSFRSQYQQVGSRLLVLFLSRIHPKKGLDLLIPAFARVIGDKGPARSSGRDAVLVIAGPEEGGYRATVEALARQFNLEDRVVFTGLLQGADRLSALADADLFVLPSYQENFGNSVVEALAAGTPVLISDRVNLHDQITAGEVGGVVPAELAPLAEALGRWLDDADLRSNAAARAPAFVRERYDWDSIARRWVGHYQRLRDRAGAASAAVPAIQPQNGG
jgi:glycosyltransferase involved in cell wall biosynthesis